MAVACVAITILSYVITHRDLMVIDLPSALRQRIYAQYNLHETDRDEFDRFALSTLGILHQFDYR